ncbi:histidine phosphatase family protein [Lacticaseibacillus porcinae]|uniref:histidine phosphatase family protein n=1 Tax=Lacticaseibacillus porcinae TaxID=1123687 RepID=UPI000F77E113|nr:histidine phosphatase family protein [Lacticaseibacillus porcinae]
MTELYLIRHGQTVYNVQHRIQGMADSELTATGIADAKALGRGLQKAGIVFDHAYASDLIRARDTAELALTAADQYLPVQLDAGLREEDYAHFEGQPQSARHEALKAILPAAQLEQLVPVANGVHQLDADAEDAHTVQMRFDQAIRRITDQPDQQVMAVAHGTVILLWLALIGFPLNGQTTMHNASVTQIHCDHGRFKVMAFDSLKYVEAGRL